jgi:hypothetical protein
MGVSSYLIDSSVSFFLVGLTGGSPAATHFLLLRQKKVSKEKATLLSASLRFAAGNLRCSVQAGSGTNSASPQTSASPDPLGPALLGAYRRVLGEQQPIPIPNSYPNTTRTSYVVSLSPRIFLCLKTRPGWAEERRLRRIRACACLSEASLRKTQAEASTAGCPKRSAGTQTAGRLSFGYFSLAKQRKVTSRRATPGQLALPSLSNSRAMTQACSQAGAQP